jgi:hypothetical protein
VLLEVLEVPEVALYCVIVPGAPPYGQVISAFATQTSFDSVEPAGHGDVIGVTHTDPTWSPPEGHEYAGGLTHLDPCNVPTAQVIVGSETQRPASRVDPAGQTDGGWPVAAGAGDAAGPASTNRPDTTSVTTDRKILSIAGDPAPPQVLRIVILLAKLFLMAGGIGTTLAFR